MCPKRVFVENIRKLTLENTQPHAYPFQESQLGRVQIGLSYVADEIPWEIHHHVTQTFRVESGQGRLEYQQNGKVQWEPLEDGSFAVVPQGVPHRIVNMGGPNSPLKLNANYIKDFSDKKWIH